jgi:hypothetical protein
LRPSDRIAGLTDWYLTLRFCTILCNRGYATCSINGSASPRVGMNDKMRFRSEEVVMLCVVSLLDDHALEVSLVNVRRSRGVRVVHNVRVKRSQSGNVKPKW